MRRLDTEFDLTVSRYWVQSKEAKRHLSNSFYTDVRDHPGFSVEYGQEKHVPKSRMEEETSSTSQCIRITVV